MPASADERATYRRKLGYSITAISDADIDAVFDYVEAIYLGENYSRNVIVQAAVVEGRSNLLAEAAKRASYKQNESSEQTSDIFRHLKTLYDEDAKELDRLKALERPSIKLRRLAIPRREYGRRYGD